VPETPPLAAATAARRPSIATIARKPVRRWPSPCSSRSCAGRAFADYGIPVRPHLHARQRDGKGWVLPRLREERHHPSRPRHFPREANMCLMKRATTSARAQASTSIY